MPPRKSTVPAAQTVGKLAPGHRLPSEIVAAHQRERLIIATMELVERQGYPATSAAQVARHASVSGAAFYKHFANKEECFIAACQEVSSRAGARVIAAYNAPGLDWRERLRAALDAYLHHARAWPQGMHICIADALSAGPRAAQLHDETMLSAQRMIAGCLSQAPDQTPLSPNLARALAGGIARVTYTLIREDRARELPGLRDDIEAWMLACRHPPVGRSGPNGKPRDKATEQALPGAIPGAIPGASEPEIASAAQTPPGTSETPAQNPRARIVEAVVELACEEGYVAMTHQQIAARAGMSYTTFYKHFQNKQDALLGAYDAGAQRIRAAVIAAAAVAPDWTAALREGLGAALQTLAGAPAFTRMWAIELPKLGPAAFQRIDASLTNYHALLDPAYERNPELPRMLPDATLGAIVEVIRHYSSQGRETELPTLKDELTFIALAPLLGPEQAAQIAGERTKSKGAR